MTAKQILTKNGFPPKVVEELIQQVNGMALAKINNREKSYAFMEQTTIMSPNITIAAGSPSSPLSVNQTISTSTPPAANSTTMNPTQIPEKKIFVGLAYIPGLTEKVTKQIKNHVPNLCAAPRPICKVGGLYSDMKEKLRLGQNSMVVYDIPCGGCHGKKGYLGETSLNLDDRCGPPGGHARDLKNIDKNPRATALVHHVNTSQHQFDFNGKRILKKVRILQFAETKCQKSTVETNVEI